MHAQDYLLANGTQVLSVGAANGTIPVADLPHSTSANYYHGDAPHYSQNIEYDAQGNLLFFVIDGAIYDAYGHLIADNLLMSGCTECLTEGTTQVAVTMVPGSCSQYYIIAAHTGVNLHTDLGYSILDMTMTNTRFPAYLGHVLNDGDSQLNAFDETAVINNLQSFGGSSPHICSVHLADVSGTEEEGMQFTIHEPTQSGVPKRLFMVDEGYVYVYNILSDGIFEVGHYTGAGGSGSYMTDYTNCAFGVQIDRPFSGCITTGENASHEVMLAFTKSTLDDDGVTYDYPNTVYLCKVPTNGHIQYITSLQTLPSSPYVSDFNIPSLAFNSDASQLFFTQSTAPYLGRIDLSTNTRYDLASQFSITNPSELGYGNMYFDTAPSGTGRVLYLIAPTRRGYLSNVDNISNLSWTGSIPGSTSISNAPTSTWADEQGDTYALPDVHNYNDQQQVNLSQSSCCEFQQGLHQSAGYDWTGTNTVSTPWQPGGNPFNNSDEVYFTSDVVVEANATLFVKDMTWRFAANAKLIIKKGGSATFTNCLLSSNRCTPSRWPGIRVEGNTSDHTQTGTHQGQLYLKSGTIVEDAVVGVRCAKELSGGALDPNGYGGRVVATNTTFHNCLMGVHILNYHRFNVNNVEVYNLCTFSSCTFTSDLQWPDPVVNTPQAHAFLYSVNAISFSNCSFRNDANNAFSWNYLHHGYGIYCLDASFLCNGYMNYTSNKFIHLTTGIYALSPDPAFPYRVDGMQFEDNYRGIMDFTSKYPRITNNKFFTLSTAHAADAAVGAYLFQSDGYIFERNYFKKPTGALSTGIGIYFRGPVTSNNRIYDNEFYQLNAGNVVQGDHHHEPTPTQSTPLGLELLCGDYQDNLIDQDLIVTTTPPPATQAYIKTNQGLGSPATAANNRFLSSRDCSNTFSPYVMTPHNTMTIKYHYYAYGSNPELRPSCVENPDLGPSITATGDFYDLYAATASDAFDKDRDCGTGVLDVPSGHHVLGDVQLKVDELTSIIHNYNDTLDGGSKLTCMEAITQDPPLPSYVVRDVLLDHYPLSDSVLIAAIHREPAMDPWHLTEVLIQNSALSKVVQNDLNGSDALDEYFMDLLAQYNTNVNLKTLLEDEMDVRSGELSGLQRDMVNMLADDSTYDHPVDTLETMFSHDTLTTALLQGYQMWLQRNAWSKAAVYHSKLSNDVAHKELCDMAALREALNGDWEQADSTERVGLYSHVVHDVEGTAWAWAICNFIGVTDSLPAAWLPPAFRAVWQPGHHRWAETDESLVAAYPNPATDHVNISYPVDVTDGIITVYDVNGERVFQGRVNPHAPFVELETGSWSSGLYLVHLTVGNLTLGSTKFSIAR